MELVSFESSDAQSSSELATSSPSSSHSASSSDAVFAGGADSFAAVVLDAPVAAAGDLPDTDLLSTA